MSNFCKHCGVKLEGSPSVCPSCNQKLNLASELLSKKSLDELKQGLMSASSKAVSIAKDVGADIASETKKINEARKEATEASDFKDAEDKKAAVKNGVLIFWSKLTTKQKLMVASVPLLLVLWLFSGGSGSKPDLKSAAIKQLDSVLIDPSSKQFRNVRTVDVKLKSGAYLYVICGEVNSKNRMGGYVGFQKFELVVDTEKTPPEESFYFPTESLFSIGKCLN